MPPTPTDDLTMRISPSVILLDNPADWSARKPSQKICVSVTARDGNGNAILPSSERPIALNVYEPVGGPIRPSTAEITSASNPTATFIYNGAYSATQ